jgi:hypothetical protein
MLGELRLDNKILILRDIEAETKSCFFLLCEALRSPFTFEDLMIPPKVTVLFSLRI